MARARSARLISLLPHEWLAVVVILGVFASLIVVTQFKGSSGMTHTASNPFYPVDPNITVFVDGAVTHAGALVVAKGTLIQEVLEKAETLPEADVSRMKLKAKARDGQVIKVPRKKTKKKKKT